MTPQYESKSTGIGIAGPNSNPKTKGKHHHHNGSLLAYKAMRLKLSGQLPREVSERRQVGDAEAMFSARDGEKPWWRNVGMEEGM